MLDHPHTSNTPNGNKQHHEQQHHEQQHHEQQHHKQQHHKQHHHEQQYHEQQKHEQHHHEQHHGNNPCISQVPIFNHLEHSQFEEIMNVTHSIAYKKGEIVYRAGSKSDALYIVSSGKIKIYRLSESGKELLIRILQVGDFTGELALFKETIHEAYAEAMEDTRVCTVRRSDLNDLLIKYPSISIKILSEFSNRLEISEKQTARVATEKVETRLALYLIELIEHKENKYELVLPMSKKDLASYLGTTPETISRKLYEFEDEGLIVQKARRKIEIVDFEGLKLI